MTKCHIAGSNGGHKSALTEHVTAIRQLGKQTIKNIVEIGQRLTECKGLVGHKNWGCWLDREFGWSERTAQRFMSVHELAEAKSDNLSDLDLPVSSLYLLAAPTTPGPVRDEIIERAKAGEKIKHADVQKAVARARPTRKTTSQRSKAVPCTPQQVGRGGGVTAPPVQQDLGQVHVDVSQPPAEPPVPVAVAVTPLDKQRAAETVAVQIEKSGSLSTDAYLSSTRDQRQQFLAAIGTERLLSDLPAVMLAELHKRLVAQYRGTPEVPLNPTEAALAQVAAEEAADDIPGILRRTKH